MQAHKLYSRNLEDGAAALWGETPLLVLEDMQAEGDTTETCKIMKVVEKVRADC